MPSLFHKSSCFLIILSNSHSSIPQELYQKPPFATKSSFSPPSTLQQNTSNMKVFAIVATGFAALAAAAPAPAPAQQCTPATYACTRHDSGWKVCNTSGNWEVSNTHEIPFSLAWPSPGPCFTDTTLSLSLPVLALPRPSASSSSPASAPTAFPRTLPSPTKAVTRREEKPR